MEPEQIQYFITAVWFENNQTKEYITFGLIHQVRKSVVFYGRKKKRAEIIELLTNKQLFIATWNYENGYWCKGALVTSETIHNNSPALKNLLNGGSLGR